MYFWGNITISYMAVCLSLFPQDLSVQTVVLLGQYNYISIWLSASPCFHRTFQFKLLKLLIPPLSIPNSLFSHYTRAIRFFSWKLIILFNGCRRKKNKKINLLSKVDYTIMKNLNYSIMEHLCILYICL